jgi:membrane associated rhomboid family serine protease
MNSKVTNYLSTLIVCVFILYKLRIIKYIPCQKNILNVLGSNFVHLDCLHMISNLIALITISRIEKHIGSKKFAFIVGFILIISSLFETIFRRVFNVRCSIGISGLLYGLFTYEIVKQREMSINIAYSITLMLFSQTINTKNVSIIGHLSGVLSGLICACLCK